VRINVLAGIAVAALSATGLTALPAQAVASPVPDVCGGLPADYAGHFKGTITLNGQPAALEVTFTEPNAVTAHLLSPAVNPVTDATKSGSFEVYNNMGNGTLKFDAPDVNGQIRSKTVVCGGVRSGLGDLMSRSSTKVDTIVGVADKLGSAPVLLHRV
jgi:hypothetical protein